MITQNPIVGRARKKLSGVYARTLYGKNIIQSCPAPRTSPPSQAELESRMAFRLVSSMANMVQPSLLLNIYYAAPVGRSRRACLVSQLHKGVVRTNKVVSFDLDAVSELGGNVVTCNEGLIYTPAAKAFEIAVEDLNATPIADTSRVPCVMAVSYEKGVCVSLFDYTTLNEGVLSFENVSDTLVGSEILLLPLWQTNIGTAQNPIRVFGGFKRD